MASYATPADLRQRYDVRTLGDLASDDDHRVHEIDIDDNDNILTALADASGEIDAALLQGERYTKADLEALTGESLSLLKRICCQLAYWYLWERRTWTDDDRYEMARDRGRKALERLRRGEVVFDLDHAKDAGLPKGGGPTRVEFRDQNLLRDFASAVYPPRRLPRGRG
jgi:phage gp36-like protein